MDIPILDDAKQSTTDFVLGRPLLRVQVRINGTVVLPHGDGLVDPGSRTSLICRSKIGDNIPDGQTDTHHGGGAGKTETFSLASIQVEQFPDKPIGSLALFDGRDFDVILGRDILRFCRLVMDPTTWTFTIDMP